MLMVGTTHVERRWSSIMKFILQISGTLASMILSFIALHAYSDQHDMGSTYSSAHWLIFASVILTVITGISYFQSKVEHEGLHYFLYAALGITHAIVVPLAITIAGLKIDFGQYWWVALLGIIGLIWWGNTNKSVRT